MAASDRTTASVNDLATGAARLVHGLASQAANHWRALITLGTFGAAFVYLLYIILAGKLGWDFAVYRAGIAAFQATGNPYDAQYLLTQYGVDLPFTYPPIAVLVFAHVSWLFDNPLALGVLMLVHVVAVIAIPNLLLPRVARAPQRDFFWMFGVYLVAFGLSGAKLLASCNIAAVLVCLCLGALVYSMRKRNYLPLWALLLVVCQIKIYLICFAVVPFLVDRKFWQPALLTALVIAGASLNYVFAPQLAGGFVETMGAFSKAPGYIGISVMEAVQIALQEVHFAKPGLIGPIALGVHAVYVALALGFAVAVLWTKARPADAHLVFLWALMTALLISPRLIENDLALLVIPFLVFLLRLIASRGVGLSVAIIAFVIAASLIKTPLADWGALVALLGVWLGQGVNWLNESGTRLGRALEADPLIARAAGQFS